MIPLLRTCAALCLAVFTAGCPTTISTTTKTALPMGELRLAVEGPCARLSMVGVGERRFFVYGETGYDLHDWAAGERLSAAQTLAELVADGPRRNSALSSGVPNDARGYVPGHLEVGGDRAGRPWLMRVTTRYAPRGTGVLFERSADAYELATSGWVAAEGPTPLDLGPASRGLPDVPTGEACESEGLRFLPLSHSFAPDGSIFVAGRCQDASHIAYADTTLVVAHAAPRASAWSFARLPRSGRLDGIVNVGIHARSASEAWAVAYEPFNPVEGRHSYLVRWDGSRWNEEDPGIDDGLMSVSADPEGRLYLAAGRALYRRERGGSVVKVPLPALRFVKEQPALHVHHVSAFARGDVWIEASYRVRVPAGEKGEMADGWASALFSNVQLERPLYCDARELAESALSEIEGETP